MEYKEIKQKTLQELENIIKDLHINLGKARFELANNTLKNISVVGKTKKNIARILTSIRSNKLNGETK